MMNWKRHGRKLSWPVLRGNMYLPYGIEVKVKVKLSLCLTKHHTMKTYWGVEV
jgi:hypothetical protein